CARSCPFIGREPPEDQTGFLAMRIYGFGARQPAGNIFLASSSLTEPEMMTSSPRFQFTGVETLCFAVSCIESSTRKISSKLRPVDIGYASINLIFLSGPMMKRVRKIGRAH